MFFLFCERETGLEPATSSLGNLHSTPELLPLFFLSKDNKSCKIRMQPIWGYLFTAQFDHRDYHLLE